MIEIKAYIIKSHNDSVVVGIPPGGRFTIKTKQSFTNGQIVWVGIDFTKLELSYVSSVPTVEGAPEKPPISHEGVLAHPNDETDPPVGVEDASYCEVGGFDFLEIPNG